MIESPVIRWKIRRKSNQFPSEAAFCDAIESAFKANRILYSREFRCMDTEARADFLVLATTIIEAKVNVNGSAFDRAIGQAIRYQREGADVIFVIPDDIALTPPQCAVVDYIKAKCVKVGELVDYLKPSLAIDDELKRRVAA